MSSNQARDMKSIKMSLLAVEFAVTVRNVPPVKSMLAMPTRSPAVKGAQHRRARDLIMMIARKLAHVAAKEDDVAEQARDCQSICVSPSMPDSVPTSRTRDR